MDEALERRLGELILQLKDGNPSALAEIDVLIGKRLRAFANRYYKQKTDIDDVIQSFLYKLYYASKRFKDEGHAYAWIIKIFKNLILSNIRHNRIETEYFKESVKYFSREQLCSKDDFYENYLFYYDLKQHFSNRDVDICYYAFVMQLSYADIAQLVRRPKSTVQYIIEKLKVKLREIYG